MLLAAPAAAGGAAAASRQPVPALARGSCCRASIVQEPPSSATSAVVVMASLSWSSLPPSSSSNTLEVCSPSCAIFWTTLPRGAASASLPKPRCQSLKMDPSFAMSSPPECVPDGPHAEHRERGDREAHRRGEQRARDLAHALGELLSRGALLWRRVGGRFVGAREDPVRIDRAPRADDLRLVHGPRHVARGAAKDELDHDTDGTGAGDSRKRRTVLAARDRAPRRGPVPRHDPDRE